LGDVGEGGRQQNEVDRASRDRRVRRNTCCELRLRRPRWKSGTEKLRARLDAARRPVGTKKYDPTELIGLPEPVQRYFRAALSGGQQVVAAVNVEHSGTFNQSDARERRKPFVSTQRALQNAASVAGLLLTAEVMIAESPKEDEHAHGAPGGGMDM
jgi:hypothetical protein